MVNDCPSGLGPPPQWLETGEMKIQSNPPLWILPLIRIFLHDKLKTKRLVTDNQIFIKIDFLSFADLEL